MTNSREKVSSSSDAELLTRFATLRDQAAFRTLVLRHSALVWGVCARRLRFREDVEDAYQAAFIKLAQQAAKVRKSNALSSWLYKVAHRCAVDTGKLRSRRECQSLEIEPVIDGKVFCDLNRREQGMVVDEEISRLPERLRTVVVLCCVEEKSRSAAAEVLECSEAVVKSRLERGRKILRMRLARRGIGLTVALGFVASASDELCAGPSPEFMESTIEAAIDTAGPVGPLGGAHGIWGRWGIPSIAAGLIGIVGISVISQLTGSEQRERHELRLATAEEQVKQPADAEVNLPPPLHVADPLRQKQSALELFLRVRAETFRMQAAAKELELQSLQTQVEKVRTRLKREAAEIEASASQKLMAAGRKLDGFSQLARRYGDNRALGLLLAEGSIQTSDEGSGAPVGVAAMAAQARGYQLPGDSDALIAFLSSVKAMPLNSGHESSENETRHEVHYE